MHEAFVLMNSAISVGPFVISLHCDEAGTSLSDPIPSWARSDRKIPGSRKQYWEEHEQWNRAEPSLDVEKV